MSLTIRIIILVGIVLYCAYITKSVKNKKLSFKLALLWYACGIVFIIIDVWPNIIFEVALILGIQIPLNGLLVLAIGIIWVINIIISGHISRITDNNMEMCQQIALLEKRIKELENNK